jgi:membrane protein implicated in regulation of membrane protease activity
VKKTLNLILACSCLALATVAVAADAPKAQAAPAAQPAAAPAAFTGGKGKVLETMNSGGYTYVKVDCGTGAVWAAAPEIKVQKGQTVSVAAGMPMANFHSKTLNRTFDVVYFVPKIDVEGAAKK